MTPTGTPPNAHDTLLDVKDLSVAFTSAGIETLAVDRVSFTINAGETLALVGESGSGKSVTALSIMQLLPYPAASHPSGEISFKGQSMMGASHADLRSIRGNRVSIIFQEPMTSLNPLHTIEQQVGEILTLHRGLSASQARVRVLELLNKVGVRDADKRLSGLSASVIGRAAPAGHDRHGSGQRTGSADRR